jgi:hypothetical protein
MPLDHMQHFLVQSEDIEKTKDWFSLRSTRLRIASERSASPVVARMQRSGMRVRASASKGGHAPGFRFASPGLRIASERSANPS